MSAPANIFPAAVARYEAVLDALKPGCIETERRQRCGILYLRDRANSGLRHASWEAGSVLHTIERLASLHGLRPMRAAELETLHQCLVRLFTVAGALETRGPHE